MSANHQKKLALAIKTLQAMKKAGADAVKIQTYTPDTMTLDCRNRHFRIENGSLWDGKTLYELYAEAYTPWEWHGKLKKAAKDLGLIFFSTPFDRTSADFLESLGVPAYKIASFEITDIPLIAHVAAKGKPVIISTGIARLDDIRAAVAECRKKGNNRIALLKCTSAYPAPIEEANLAAIPDMRERFGTAVGLSDHTMSVHAPAASVALGAAIIEKHFILSRSMGGPDSAFSLEPEEFRRMADAVRETGKALGEVSYELSPLVQKNRIFARSLFVVEDIRKGELFTEGNIRSIRPGCGLSPRHMPRILGKKARTSVKRGTPLKWSHVCAR
jgi:pseudaminic acid synthase